MMLALIALIALQAVAPCNPTPRPVEPASLIVQVVDPVWLPLPGIELRLTPRGGGASQIVRTTTAGAVELWLPREREFKIEVKHPGFKSAKIEWVRTPPLAESGMYPTAQVQIRLALAGKPAQVR